MTYQQPNEGIFNINNPYGYKLNVNHPKINDLYRRYKKWKGLPDSKPLSDEQRFEFEGYVLQCIKTPRSI